MGFISLVLSYGILSGNLIASDIQSDHKNPLLYLEQEGIITPEQRIKLESGEKLKVWGLSCKYEKCYNKFNKDDICKGSNTDDFNSLKNDKVVLGDKGKYSLSVFNKSKIVFGNTLKEPHLSYGDDSVYSLTKTMIVFDKKTNIITKTIQKSFYREEDLLDKKIYGNDSYVIYKGKCRLKDNTD